MMRVRVATSGWTGGPGLNTFYFNDAVENTAAAQLCYDRVRNAFLEADVIYPASVTIIVNPAVDIITPETGELTGSLLVTPGADVVGLQAANAIAPPATAMLLRLLTDTFSDGSRIQGRAFFSPIANLFAHNDGTPDATAVTALQAAGAELLDVGVGGPDLQVWRRPRKADSTVSPPITAREGMQAQVSVTQVPDKFAVLRSRRD